MSDTPNPNLNSNTPNQETNPEPSSNLEQSSEHNPNSEQAQSSDASNQESTSLSASTLATLCLIGALIGLLPFIPSPWGTQHAAKFAKILTRVAQALR